MWRRSSEQAPGCGQGTNGSGQITGTEQIPDDAIHYHSAGIQEHPPLGNEFIVLIKETSIVGYVGMSDLTRVANQMTSKLFDVFTPLLGIAFIYFVLTKVLSILLAKLERRLRKSDNR